MFFLVPTLLSIFLLFTLTHQAPHSLPKRGNSCYDADLGGGRIPIESKVDEATKKPYLGYKDAVKEFCHRVTHMGEHNAPARLRYNTMVSITMKRLDENNLISGPRIYFSDGTEGQIEFEIHNKDDNHVHVVVEQFCNGYLMAIVEDNKCVGENGDTQGGTREVGWPDVSYHAYVMRDNDLDNYKEMNPKVGVV